MEHGREHSNDLRIFPSESDANELGVVLWPRQIANLPAQYNISRSHHTLVRSNDPTKTDLLASYTNGQTLADQGVQ